MKVSPVLIAAIGAVTGLLVFGAGLIRTLSASRTVAQSGNSFWMELDPGRSAFRYLAPRCWLLQA
jgi:hypothetical protein